MKKIQYRFIDKSTWDRGEWDSEPDKVQWQDKATGLPCLAVRNGLGNWCGYVGVLEEHPWFGQDYTEHDVEIDCHGGLTFSGLCAHDEKEHGICHAPGEGEPDKVWWFGFDCLHAGDIAPGMAALVRGATGKDGTWPGDVYRNLGYVRQECAGIARQIAAKSL